MLERLTSIIAHMSNDNCSIIGLEFIYHEFSKLSGFKGNVELSMIVDEAAREQIIDIGVNILQKSSDPRVQGFEMLHAAHDMVFW